jgi:hypothetical protein
MKKIDHGFGAIGLIVLSALLSCYLATALPIIRSEEAHLSDWLGFAGGAVGGAMTLIAAVMAWFAVQRQIDEQKRDRRTREQEAKTAANLILAQTLHAAAALASANKRVLDGINITRPGGMMAMEYDADIQNRFEDLNRRFPQLEMAMAFPPIMEVWKDLNVVYKGTFLMIIATLHTILNIHKNPGPQFDRMRAVRFRHTEFMRIQTYVSVFDAELSSAFHRDCGF